jgi:hypothetical protein
MDAAIRCLIAPVSVYRQATVAGELAGEFKEKQFSNHSLFILNIGDAAKLEGAGDLVFMRNSWSSCSGAMGSSDAGRRVGACESSRLKYVQAEVNQPIALRHTFLLEEFQDYEPASTLPRCATVNRRYLYGFTGTSLMRTS